MAPAGAAARASLKLQRGRAQTAEELAGRLQAAVVRRRHDGAGERVAVPALQRQLLENAAAAGQLQRAGGRVEADLRRIRLGLVHGKHGGGLVRPVHAHAGGLVHQQARRAQRRADLGDRALHERMVGHGLGGGLEGLRLRVLEHVVERRLADAEVHGGVAEGEAREVDAQQAARRAHDVRLRHEAVVADRVADGAAHARRVPDALDLHARVRARDHRRDHALRRARRPLHDAGDEVVVGGVADRAELLDDGHAPAAVGMPEDGVEHELVAERLLRLAGDGRDQPAALDDLGEPAPLLRLGAERVDEAGDRAVHVEGQRGRRAAARHLAQRVRVGDGLGADAAVGAGDGERQQARRVKVAVVLVRKRGLGVVAGGARCEARARQLGHARNDLGLVAGERRQRQRVHTCEDDSTPPRARWSRDLDTPEGSVLTAPMPEAPLLRTEALTRAFGSLIAVDRVDVAVRRGADRRRRARPRAAAHGRARRQSRAPGRAPRPRREAPPGDRHRAGLRAAAPAARRADGGHEPRGDGRDDAADPRADGGAYGDPRRAQDEGRHEDLQPRHGPPPGAGAGRGDAGGDPRQRARAADGPGRRPLVALLELEDVHTYYGEAHILQGVSLAVGEGEVVSLIGRNGAGKTTTLRSIMGLTRPARGRVRLRGEDLTRLPTHEIVRRGIAWIPEDRRVLPNLTVLENLRLGMLGVGAREAEVAARLEEVFGHFPRLRERIDHGGPFLSGGEQQMVAIARALVARPTVMLVDEPTEGLAPMLVQSLTAILAAINRGGTTILLVEQTLEVALALSRRVYVLDQGRVQFQGTPDELRRDPTIQQRFLEV